MEGITEQSDSPSDQQSPFRIWRWGYYKNIDQKKILRIRLLPSPKGRFTKATGRFTTAQACQDIGSLQGPADDVWFFWEKNSVCSDSDLKSLGSAMHGLQGIRELLYIHGAWTDEKASLFLRQVAAKTSFGKLEINANPLRIPSILAETQFFPFLRTLKLSGAKLDEDDCRILEQVLQGHHHGEDFRIFFCACSFPSFKGYFVVADAAINTGGMLSYALVGEISVRDASIPDSASDSSTMNGESHCTFYNIYERNKADGGEDARRWKELKGKYFEDYCFKRAAEQHMDRYGDLNRAGRLKLFNNEQTPTVRECVDVLYHDKVRNCVDYLFHFITMHPGVYAAAAAVKND